MFQVNFQSKEFQPNLESYGFEVKPLTSSSDDQEKSDGDHLSQLVLEKMDVFEQGSLEITEKFIIGNLDNMLNNLKSKSEQYRDILNSMVIDLIVIDSYIGNPILTESGIPWVWLYSAAPLMIFNNAELPPPWSGMLVWEIFNNFISIYKTTI